MTGKDEEISRSLLGVFPGAEETDRVITMSVNATAAHINCDEWKTNLEEKKI